MIRPILFLLSIASLLLTMEIAKADAYDGQDPNKIYRNYGSEGYGNNGGNGDGWRHGDHGGHHGNFPNQPNFPRPFPPRGPGFPPPYSYEEVAVIQQNFQGNFGLQIAQYLNLARHQGQILRAVTLRASTARGLGMANFCTNRGCTPSAQVGYYLNDYTFPLYGEVVDGYSYNWTLNLQGNFWIDSIVLHFNP